jgi:undecaprenyl-diphosphatase
MQHLMGIDGRNFHLFLEFVNIGTLLALIVYFRKRIAGIFVDVFKRHDYKLAINILITAVPAGLVGLVAASLIDGTPFFGHLASIAVAMGLVGILMILVDRLPRLSKLKDENHLPKSRALMIGLAQVLALIPGVSRSGSTILTGRLMGLNSKSAAEYSFLASIPLMCGVVLKTILSDSSRDYFAENASMLVLANIVAFTVGIAVIGVLLNYLKKRGALQVFGWYRVILASVVLIVVLIQ